MDSVIVLNGISDVVLLASSVIPLFLSLWFALIRVFNFLLVRTCTILTIQFEFWQRNDISRINLSS